MKSRQQQQELLEQTFTAICVHLDSLIGRFGGKKVEQEFRHLFYTEATTFGLQYDVNMDEGEFKVTSDTYDWSSIQQLLAEAIEYTSGLTGGKTVAKEIRLVVKQLEKQSGENLYEIGYKLGIHKHLD